MNDLIEINNISNVELQFTDLLGKLRGISITPERYLEAVDKGKVFDGSSVYMAPVECSDLVLKPISGTALRLPWDPTTARVLCDIYIADSCMREYEVSPRFILKRSIEKAKEMGYEFYTAVENEFFILKNGELIDRSGYFSVTPLDKTKQLRQKLFETLASIGIEVEYMHHEVAMGQAEITLKVQNALKMADNVVTFRYLAQNMAAAEGLAITFMPKFRVGINGSGLHFHMSLLDSENKKNLFYDENDPHKLSKTAKHFMAGILEHFRSLTGITAPTINSRKRLVPGYEAPINKAWGPKNRSALIRIPSFGSENGARIEYRASDSTGNIYLAFACLLAAGLDGIERELDPGEPYLKNTYEHESEFVGKTLPRDQEEVIEELEKDSLIKETLGEEAFRRYVELRRKEWEEYKAEHPNWNPLEITNWEIERYLTL